MRRSVLRALALGAAVVPSAALAHTGHGETAGFVHGFTHPVGGLDHVLAMVTVGVLAAQIGGRALWLVPASFVGVMALGGLLGIAGMALPFVEVVIALSVLVLGAVVALGWRVPAVAAMVLVGCFALFHGYAHGAEMPADVGALAYAGGFMTATALLHLVGIAVGQGIGRADAWLSRTAGAAVCIVGAVLVAGAV